LVLYEQMMDKGQNGARLPKRRKHQEASWSTHIILRSRQSLSTAISQVDRDAFGRKLPLATRLQMWRLRKWQYEAECTHPSTETLPSHGRTRQALRQTLHSTPVKEKSRVVYRKALDKGLVRGRSIAAIAAASLYAACRGSGTPRTLREIAEASLVDKKDVSRCYRLLLCQLDLHMPIADPLTYVSKIAEKLAFQAKPKVQPSKFSETQGASVLQLEKTHGFSSRCSLHCLLTKQREKDSKRYC